MLPLFILSVKLLKTTTDVAARKKSNENHLKLDNCQLNKISVDTLGLLATWPEFRAIGLSFFGFIPFLPDFVPGDFHWYLISLLFFCGDIMNAFRQLILIHI